VSIFTKAFNRLGGYDSLAERFPGGPEPQGTQAAIHVPWAEIRAAQSALLYWRNAARLTCGDPAAGTITVWQPVWDAAGPLWQAARAAGPPPPASTDAPAT